MAYNHPLHQRRRQGLAGRTDIDEVDFGGQPGPPSYLYRPRDLLCDRNEEGKLVDYLGRRGLEPRERQDLDRERFDVIRLDVGDDLREWRNVPQLVAHLRDEGFNATPNHVFPAAPAYQGCPDGDPEPCPPAGMSFDPPAGEPPVVAVLDTKYTWKVYESELDSRIDKAASAPGVEANEPIDATPPPGKRDDAAGHALFIVGLIASECASAKIVLHPVLSSDGYTDEYTLSDAIMSQASVDVINVSLAGPAGHSLPSSLISAVEVVRETGNAVIVAAVGNNGSPASAGWFYPAHLERALQTPLAERIIVGVGAVDDGGNLEPYSNYPADAWALGDAESTFFKGTEDAAVAAFNGQARWAGTSFATARVTADIACAKTRGIAPREYATNLIITASPTSERDPSRLARARA